MLFMFFVFEWKYSFWGNLVQKIKILILSWNLVPTLIQTCRIQWWYSFILFLIENTIFGQIWSKKSKLSVEAEIWYLDLFEYAEFNDAVHAFCFWVERPFFGKFGPKSQNYQLKLKFVTETNFNMQNSMMRFSFVVFEWKYPFRQIWFKKSKLSVETEIWCLH